MRVVFDGLGRMGLNMALRSIAAGVEVYGYDQDEHARQRARKAGVHVWESLEEIRNLPGLQIVWCMLPAGEVTGGAMHRLAGLVRPGGIVIDGANSHYRDSVAYARLLAEQGVRFLDAGVSGGVHGRARGYCLMIGGDRKAFDALQPLFRSLAPGVDAAPRTAGRGGEVSLAEQGYLYCGPAGAGAFVKMVHNAIEYGVMQALCEGLALLCAAGQPTIKAEERYDLNVAEIMELWRRGSVVVSWLLDLMAMALSHDPELKEFQGRVGASGEAQWAVDFAMQQKIPVFVTAAALFVRFRSLQSDSVVEKGLSALRSMFGGHQEEEHRGDDQGECPGNEPVRPDDAGD